MGKVKKQNDLFGQAGLWESLAKGDIWTRLSAIVMGLGCFARKQIARGLVFLTFEGLFIWYMLNKGIYWISMLPSLGKVGPTMAYDEFYDAYIPTYGDNSFQILLYGILSIFLIIAFIFTWALNIKMSYDAQVKDEQGKKVNKLKDDLANLLDENFYKTLLTLPIIGITVFTFMPTVFMILIAFTNYDGSHDGYITNLFHWVSLDNFRTMFSSTGGNYLGTFLSILGWTLVWAFFATFSNYFLGILVALMINKKGIKLKKMWRTILVMTIAIPQFISLLYVSKMFSKSGIVNGFLTSNGFTKSQTVYYVDPDTNTGISVSPEKGIKMELASTSVPGILSGGDIIITSPADEKLRVKYTLNDNKELDEYLSDSEADAFLKEYGLKAGGAFINEKVYKPLIQQPYDFWNEQITAKLPDWEWLGSLRSKPLFSFWTAQLMVILINIWIGIPYLVLIATGILMNIPADLYEASRIDGASPRQQFRYITMPYMLFVTAPYLLTSFTGNINNFNVIYLLTGGGPTNAAASSAAGSVGHTDLLITWLFKITQGTEALYYMASVIGIVIFVIVATLTLTIYNRLGSNKNEGDMA